MLAAWMRVFLVFGLALLALHSGASAAPTRAAGRVVARVALDATFVPPPKAGSGAAPFQDCPAFGVIGSRGSGENDPSAPDWGQGLGPPDDDFAKAFGKLVPGVEYTYNPAPGYPAVSLTTSLHHFDLYRQAVTTGTSSSSGCSIASITSAGRRQS